MIFEINRESINKLIESIENESDNLGEIILPILSKFELEKKEVLEVCQIGKFVKIMGAKFGIKDKPKPPSPDFTIKYQDKLIGLEHTRIFTEEASTYFKIKTLLDYAEQIFEQKYPNTNVHATFSILNDKWDYSQNEKPGLAKEIADMVQLKRLGKEFQLLENITRIKTSKHSQVSFSYKEKNQQDNYLTKARLLQEVKKKEGKISGYKTNITELHEYWLVLVIGSLSSVSYKLDEMIDYTIESDFERVYLMNDFDVKVIRVV